jgi:CheY-like chemotaxis protein
MELSESSSTDPSTSQAPVVAKALRVLLVDADPEYLAANQQRLELDGHEVHTATDGGSALELAAAWAPDLVVLAMVLPGMDGLAVLETLRTQERTRSLPVIVLSSNTERRLVRRSRELGAVDYLSKLSKSTDPAMLSSAVFAWLSSRRVPSPV